MRLNSLEIVGFKSFSKKINLEFGHPVVCIVGPNGSGKSNVVEAFRYVLGEQSMKSMRGKMGLDLIFKGSKNLPRGSRATVTIYFNNTDKIFRLSNEGGEEVNLDYDVVSISREVYPDGINKYILNGTEVRLKDINNLLASVNIGSSGHHIISQGEADRVLNSNQKDLREIIEDALGLKIYQYKIRDTVRKLEKTNENMKEVILLRRENAPHLNFLRKQVEKFEKAKEMQTELATIYRDYLKREDLYLEEEKSKLVLEKEKISLELKNVTEKINFSDERNETRGSKKIDDLRALEKKINEIRVLKNELGRKLGRIEGMIEIEEARRDREPEERVVSEAEVKSILNEINNSIDEAILKESLSEIKSVLERIKDILSRFGKTKEHKDNFVENLELKKNREEVNLEMGKVEAEENKMVLEVDELKREIDREMEMLRDLEREKFSLKVRHQELSSLLELVHLREINLKERLVSFENELKEGAVLIGREILDYKNHELGREAEASSQEEQKRKIERLKIKLEDAGMGAGPDIMREFKEVSERDQFLSKEMEDLEKSVKSLEELMLSLKEKIDKEFKEGVKKINVEFKEFFRLMFGGGDASLSLVIPEKRKKRIRGDDEDEGEDVVLEEEEEGEVEEGVEISVSLPHKKVKELHALSGGERSLTSIALLFAMSQVNPPPFLILDETDAALDESNSRKFGDMIEKLSKHSQLIVVTHNRETMSRAGILYGVTIGSDGASKLLSVKFEEAAAIAK
ncbi:AAA family ATPase [Candidatus Nomurabacteria bacterium]|nr:AAA family ATPase [Candidatus Nomurabacteria bacterium]